MKPLYRPISCAQQGVWALLCGVLVVGRLIGAAPSEHTGLLPSKVTGVDTSIWCPLAATATSSSFWGIAFLEHLEPVVAFSCPPARVSLYPSA